MRTIEVLAWTDVLPCSILKHFGLEIFLYANFLYRESFSFRIYPIGFFFLAKNVLILFWKPSLLLWAKWEEKRITWDFSYSIFSCIFFSSLYACHLFNWLSFTFVSMISWLSNPFSLIQTPDYPLFVSLSICIYICYLPNLFVKYLNFVNYLNSFIDHVPTFPPNLVFHQSFCFGIF